MNKYDKILSIIYYVFCFILIVLGLSYLCIINKFIGFIAFCISIYLYLAFISIPFEQKHRTIIDDTKEHTTLLILNISYEDYIKLSLEEKTKIKNSFNK